MSNPFDNLVNAEFKQVFNNAIDSLLKPAAFSTPCKLEYSTTNFVFCNNCLYDPISNKSSGSYNSSTGTDIFENGSICPVCMGIGKKQTPNSETINMAIIIASKSWSNFGSPSMHVPNIDLQTLCSIELLPKINTCTSMTILDSSQYDNSKYSLAGFPNIMGLGYQNYILSNWKKL
jgi:hypothetical protein